MIGPENKDVTRSYFEDFLNLGNLAVAETLFTSDVKFHYPLGELRGIESVREYVASFRAAFPDVRFTIEALFGEKEFVACRWTLTGTQKGVFRGRPPSGEQVKVPGNTIFCLTEGRIEEMWVAFNPDLLGTLE